MKDIFDIIAGAINFFNIVIILFALLILQLGVVSSELNKRRDSPSLTIGVVVFSLVLLYAVVTSYQAHSAQKQMLKEAEKARIESDKSMEELKKKNEQFEQQMQQYNQQLNNSMQQYNQKLDNNVQQFRQQLERLNN